MNPTPHAQLAYLGAALSATAEVAAMIDLTAEAHADSFAMTEAGARLLALRPDFDEFAHCVADCIDGVATGQVEVETAGSIAASCEYRVHVVGRALGYAEGQRIPIGKRPRPWSRKYPFYGRASHRFTTPVPRREK